MKDILILGKMPPIQGGVSATTFNAAMSLATNNRVHFVTNSRGVEYGSREILEDDDLDYMRIPGLFIHDIDDHAIYHHVPYSVSYFSRLYGKACAVCREFDVSLIIGWYLEPYCLVASIVARSYNLPLIVRHAGSDIGRLARNPDLFSAYRTISSIADRIVVSSNSEARRVVDDLGFSESQLFPRRGKRLPEYFLTSINHPWSFDIDAFHQNYTPHFLEKMGLDRSSIRKILNRRPSGECGFMIGSYGKVGAAKGSDDLLLALDDLTTRRVDYGFVACVSGARGLKKYLTELCKRRALLERTWLLPPMAPWKVPTLLSRFSATAFLESGFPISFHNPIVPREILSRGSCLIVSRDIYLKQRYREDLVNWKNCVVVDDPSNTGELARAIGCLAESGDLGSDIGLHGRYVSERVENNLSAEDCLLECAEPYLYR